MVVLSPSLSFDTASAGVLVTVPSRATVNVIGLAVSYPVGGVTSLKVYVPATSFTLCGFALPSAFLSSASFPDVQLSTTSPFSSVPFVILSSAPASSSFPVRLTLLISMSLSRSASFIVTFVPLTAPSVVLVTVPSRATVNVIELAVSYPVGAFPSLRVYVPATSFTLCGFALPSAFLSSASFPDVQLATTSPFSSVPFVILSSAPASSSFPVRLTLLISISIGLFFIVSSPPFSQYMTFGSFAASSCEKVNSCGVVSRIYPSGAFVSIRRYL